MTLGDTKVKILAQTLPQRVQNDISVKIMEELEYSASPTVHHWSA